MSKRDSGALMRQAPPIGSHVVVNGGRYQRDQGVVVLREPDLRPGSVWVRLIRAGTHLVPVFRLSTIDEPTAAHEREPSGEEPAAPAVEALVQLTGSLSGTTR
jgi:hypothetical protein